MKHFLVLVMAFLSLTTQSSAQWSLTGNNVSGTNKFLGSTNAKDLIIKTNNTEAMRIKGTTGADNHWIGIGMDASIPNPLNQFHLHNSAIRLTGNVPGFGGPMLLFGGDMITAPNGEWGVEYSTIDQGINFWRPFGATGTSGNYFMFLKNDGHVGINTNNPTAQFTVFGKTLMGDPSVVNINTLGNYNLYVQNGILTEKLRVAVVNSGTWADYVFDENYALKSLEEVAAFIKLNKHLPNVPSAKEVERVGVDMVEMDATLLAKIEELTLYLLEQDRRIALLEKKLAEK